MLQVFIPPDDRTRVLIERGADVDLDAVQCSELDRARVHHLRPPPRHLRHLGGGDLLYPPCVGDYSRIGRVDAVHVRVDLALVRPKCRYHCDGSAHKAAATPAAVVSDPPRPSVITSPSAFVP